MDESEHEIIPRESYPDAWAMSDQEWFERSMLTAGLLLDLEDHRG